MARLYAYLINLLLKGEVFPEGSGHQRLLHFVGEEEIVDFLFRHQEYLDVLSGVEMLAG